MSETQSDRQTDRRTRSLARSHFGLFSCTINENYNLKTDSELSESERAAKDAQMCACDAKSATQLQTKNPKRIALSHCRLICMQTVVENPNAAARPLARSLVRTDLIEREDANEQTSARSIGRRKAQRNQLANSYFRTRSQPKRSDRIDRAIACGTCASQRRRCLLGAKSHLRARNKSARRVFFFATSSAQYNSSDKTERRKSERLEQFARRRLPVGTSAQRKRAKNSSVVSVSLLQRINALAAFNCHF